MTREQTTGQPARHLRRYTRLEYALELIQNGQLALPDPGAWEDQNDLFSIRLYKEKTGTNTVRICCLAGIKGTFHHWKVFTEKDNGVCLILDQEKLESELERQGVELRPILYRNVPEMQKLRGRLNPADLPYLKWSRYEAENEYRAFWSSAKLLPEGKPHFVTMRAVCIHSVEISPLLAEKDRERHRLALEAVCRTRASHVKICPNRTTNSEIWQAAVTKAVRPGRLGLRRDA